MVSRKCLSHSIISTPKGGEKKIVVHNTEAQIKTACLTENRHLQQMPQIQTKYYIYNYGNIFNEIMYEKF